MNPAQPSFDYARVERLLTEERTQITPPDTILAPLEIGGDDLVADVGCGPAFLTLAAAAKTQGRVYALDMESEMLKVAEQRALEANVTNITWVQSTVEEIQLPDASVEKAIVSLVLHEVKALTQAISELRRILRPGGRVLIVEWEIKESDTPEIRARRVEKSVMEAELQAAGFQTELFSLTDEQYCVVGSLV